LLLLLLLLVVVVLGPGACTRGSQVCGGGKQTSLLLHMSSLSTADLKALAASS
jgi:hypothetical protein